MSLAVLADHMASKGRGSDSMLIHMSPREVQGLQALAEHHGGTLTINPDTGLPEANFLEKLLPTIIGVGISYFSGGTIDPKTAGMIVGGLETARTGDIGKGIQAGLGAYGGATLGSGFTTTGTEAIGSGAAADAYANLGTAAITDAQAIAQGFGSAEELMQTKAALASQEATAAATPFEKLSAGAGKAADNPMQYLKANAMPLLYAAGPAILAGANVKSNMPQTVTKPGMIRPYSFDPYGGSFTAYPAYEAAPTKAAEGGLMGMAAGGIAGYGDGDDVPKRINDGMAQGGMYDFAQRSEPVVRMAEGGVPGYAGGALVNDQQIFDYFKTPGLTDAQIAKDMQTFQVSAADIARATGTQGQQADYEKRFVNTLVAPGTDASEFMAATKAVGLQDQALTNAMQNANLSAASQYALTHNLADTSGVTGTDFYNKIGYTAGSLPGDQGGLEGLYANINNAASGLQSKINSGALTVAQAQDLALAEANRIGVSLGDINAATGKTIGTLFTPKTVSTIVGGGGNDTITGGTGNDTLVGGTGNDVITPKGLTCGKGYHLNAAGTACVPDAPVIIDYKDCPSGYHWDKAAQACVKNIDVVQDTTTTVTTPTSLITAADTSLPVGVSGTTGPSIFGGGATVNPNGTITTSPVIPGIPVGGFTGMEDVRNAYTKGGGSLGYVPYAPKTMAEFDTKYTSKLTGGSKAAYDYLTGKTPYSPTPYTPTGQIFKPYSEAMGIPQDLTKRRYLFDPVTKTYKLNPDYKPPSYATAGTAAGSTAAITNPDKKPTDDPGAGNQWTWDDTAKKWTAKPISGTTATVSENDSRESGGAANGGLMALNMAVGGSAQYDLGGYSDGGRLLRGPGDGVSDSIPATIGNKRPARLADGEFVVPARIVSELGNGSTEAGARKLYDMMNRVQAARRSTVGKGKVAKNSRADKYLPA